MTTKTLTPSELLKKIKSKIATHTRHSREASKSKIEIYQNTYLWIECTLATTTTNISQAIKDLHEKLEQVVTIETIKIWYKTGKFIRDYSINTNNATASGIYYAAKSLREHTKTSAKRKKLIEVIENGATAHRLKELFNIKAYQYASKSSKLTPSRKNYIKKHYKSYDNWKPRVNSLLSELRLFDNSAKKIAILDEQNNVLHTF